LIVGAGAASKLRHVIRSIKGAAMRFNGIRNTKAVAVIGSIAAIGGGATAVAATHGSEHSRTTTSADSSLSPRTALKPLASLSSAELAALAKARSAIAVAAVSIARPILERAVADGSITAAEQAQFLRSLSATNGPGAGVDGTWTGATGASGASGPPVPPSSGAASNASRAVFASIETAIAAKVGAIATPVLDAAVSSGSIGSAQETALLTLLERGPIGAPGGSGGPAAGRAPSGPPPSA
jgi:hypothetical protein